MMGTAMFGRRMLCHVATGVVLLIFMTSAQGFPNGAPFSSCVNRMPHHHHLQPQTSPPPYELVMDAQSYSAGDTIRITLMARAGEHFRGFQIRAERTTGDTEEVVGEFIAYPPSALPQFWYPQPGVQYNCVTQRDNSDKEEVIVTWSVNTNEGDIVFRSGVVRDFETFWGNVESPVLKGTVPVRMSPPPHQVNPDFSEFDFVAECGVSKGCVLHPGNCRGRDCQAAAAYHVVDGNKIHVEMMGNTDDYISVGWSRDKKMGEFDSTMTCVISDDVISVQQGINPHLYNLRHRAVNITDIHIIRQDGRLYCSFVRPLSVSMEVVHVTDGVVKDREWRSFDLGEPLYWQLAWGHVYLGSDSLGKHEELPFVSREPIDVFSAIITTGNTLSLELQLHVCFGLLAYLFIPGFGMLLARHYREEIKRPCCNLAAWFQTHRLAMALSTACAIVAIALALVHLNGTWTEYATIHAVFGLTAAGLFLVNILAGLLRPAPQHSRRQAFNWIHRTVAILGWLAGAICLILGTRLPLLTSSLQLRETILVAVGLSFQILLEIVLEINRCRMNNAAMTIQRGKKAMDQLEIEEPSGKKTSWSLKMACIVLYAIIMAAISMVALYFLFIS